MGFFLLVLYFNVLVLITFFPFLLFHLVNMERITFFLGKGQETQMIVTKSEERERGRDQNITHLEILEVEA